MSGLQALTNPNPAALTFGGRAGAVASSLVVHTAIIDP